MSVIGMLLAALAAATFYAASPHRRWRAAWRPRAAWLRAAAVACLGAAMAVAAQVMGPWPGVFASLSAFMLAGVLVPALDVGVDLPQRRRRHVG